MTLRLIEPNGVKFQAKGGKGEIILYGDIGFEVTAKSFSDEFKALGEVSALDVRINSFGGDVFDGVAIYNRIVQAGKPTTVYVDGIAASAASIIAMAGDEILMAESSFMMIHDAWALTMGNARELRDTADRLEAVSEQMGNIYAKKTGQDYEKVRQMMAEETEFNAAEALELGFASSIFEAERMAARFDPERHHFKRKPVAAMSEERQQAARLISEMRMLAAR